MIYGSGNIMNIVYPSDTWGAKESAFASNYRTASGIFVEDSLPIVSDCDYSALEQSLTSTTLNVNSLIEGFVQCKFSKLGFRHLKTLIDLVWCCPLSWQSVGEGGFGAVFEGNGHGTKVAIKRIFNFHWAVSRTMGSLDRYSYISSLLQMRSTT